jgi:prevent-host-death family protein
VKTLTIREIQRNLRKALAWVKNGEEVLIMRNGRPVARLIAPTPMPDFAARARAIWGAEPEGQSLSSVVLAEREERL